MIVGPRIGRGGNREAIVTFRHILIAVDDSPIAAHAADVGVALARSLEAEVAFVHVYGPPVPYDSDLGVPVAELAAQAEAEGKRLLAGFRARLELPAPALEFARAGTPSAEIARAAKDWPADLVVIGSHGRGGVQRILLGSVAEGVMREAPCPVLVVRAGD